MRNGASRNSTPAANFQIEISSARRFHTTLTFFQLKRESARIFLIEGNQVRESSPRSRKLRRLRRWRAARNVNKMFTRSLVLHDCGPTWKVHVQTHVDVFVGVGRLCNAKSCRRYMRVERERQHAGKLLGCAN